MKELNDYKFYEKEMEEYDNLKKELNNVDDNDKCQIIKNEFLKKDFLKF